MAVGAAREWGRRSTNRRKGHHERDAPFEMGAGCCFLLLFLLFVWPVELASVGGCCTIVMCVCFLRTVWPFRAK